MSHNRRTMIAGTAAVGLGALTAGRAAAATTVKVNIPRTMTAFDPPEVTIKKGDSVEWRNRSVVPHTVTTDPKKSKKPELISIPAGAKAFDSGPMKQDQLFTQKFTVAGTYKYICLEHEGMGMTGTVIVE